MGSSLNWTFLDIEEAEWEQVVGAAEAADTVAATAAVAQPATADASAGTPEEHSRTSAFWRRALFVICAIALLAAAGSYAVWRRAEDGLARLRGSVAVAVKAETLAARARASGECEQSQLEAVEFLNGQAMAQVVITRTVAAGYIRTRRETRFYALTGTGWAPVAPVSAFWGDQETLETRHLRFVFRTRDRALVTAVASEAEAYYAALQRVAARTEMPSAGSSALLTIELLPEAKGPCTRQTLARIGLTSPLLYKPPLGQLPDTLFASQLRYALTCHLLDVEEALPPPRAGWHLLAAGLHVWFLRAPTCR
jgi:hypothetical protein